MINQTEIGKLLLRLSLGILILFHGIHKLIYGIDNIKSIVVNNSLPEFLAYGVYMAELIAPIFIILGLYARVASIIISINMIMAIILVYGITLSANKYGALLIETPLVFLILSLLVILMGSGKYAVNNK